MFNKIKDYLAGELWTDYSLFERIFLISMLLVQVIVFIVAPDTPLGVISGISGVLSVVMCAKGKISFYYIGFVQTISYLILSYQNQFYGEVIENIFYLVTMIMGIFMWKKNMSVNENGNTEVQARAFTVSQWVLSVVLTIITTYVTGLVLTRIGNAQPFTDAATNVLAIFAQILMIKRYREQWIWWIAIDLLCIKLWYVAGNWSMVAMYVAWTANCVYGWYNWTKLERMRRKAVVTQGWTDHGY